MCTTTFVWLHSQTTHIVYNLIPPPPPPPFKNIICFSCGSCGFTNFTPLYHDFCADSFFFFLVRLCFSSSGGMHFNHVFAWLPFDEVSHDKMLLYIESEMRMIAFTVAQKKLNFMLHNHCLLCLTLKFFITHDTTTAIDSRNHDDLHKTLMKNTYMYFISCGFISSF